MARKYTPEEYREIRNARKRQKRLEQGAIPRPRLKTEEERAAARERELAAKRTKYEEAMALLRQPENADLREEHRAAKRAALKAWREADRKKRGLPPPKVYAKYATSEERLAAQKAQAKKSREAARERRGLPPAAPVRKYASRAEREAAHREYTREWRAEERQRKAEAVRQARAFIHDVPAIMGSKTRTRLFITLCEYGPATSRDLTIYASPRDLAPTQAMKPLVDLGIVVTRKQSRFGMFRYYLNPGHPAHRELLAFGLALAARWPSPWRRPRKVDQTPVPLKKSADEPFPANLFAQDRATRVLMLVAVSGGIISQQLAKDTYVASQSGHAALQLRRFEERGLVVQEREKMRGRKGSPKGRFSLNPGFFAAAELKNLLFALCATVYDDIPGIARGLAKRDERIARHLAEFDWFARSRARADVPPDAPAGRRRRRRDFPVAPPDRLQ